MDGMRSPRMSVASTLIKLVSEISKYGNSSYTVQLTDGVLTIPWQAESHTRRAMGIVVDTDTASLNLDVIVRIEINPAPVLVSGPPEHTAPGATITAPPDTSRPGVSPAPGQAITAAGIFCLGLIVGLIAGLVLFKAKSVGLKFAAGVVSLMLSGLPIAFLPGGSWLRFVYPIGLLMGVLSLRLINSRVDLPPDPGTRRTMAIIDSIAIVVIMITALALVIASASRT